jgi:hypothetical protein
MGVNGGPIAVGSERFPLLFARCRSEGLDVVVVSQAAEGAFEPGHREPAQVGARAAAADQEEIVGPVEIASARADHGLHEHVAEQMQPEPAAVLGRQRPHARVACDRLPQKPAIVKGSGIPTWGLTSSPVAASSRMSPRAIRSVGFTMPNHLFA